MKFENIDWADSNIDKIEIEYDCAKLLIFNDTLQKNVCVSCTGFVGLTNLCIWDDKISTVPRFCLYRIMMTLRSFGRCSPLMTRILTTANGG